MGAVGSAIESAANIGISAAQVGASIKNNKRTNEANLQIAKETNATNAANVAATNEANLKANQATNAANLQIAQETNKSNAQIAQMNNEYNEQMLERQIQQQWDMWNAQNEYNSASSQRQRLEEAGLNPYLMMSGGSAGTASAMTSPSAQPASAYSAQGATMQSPEFIAAQAQGATMIPADFSSMQGLKGALRNFYELVSMNQDIKQKQVNTQLGQIDAQYKAMDWLTRIEKARKETDNIDVKTKLSRIEAKYADDMFAGQLNQIRTDNMFKQINSLQAMYGVLNSAAWYKALPQQIKNTLNEQAARINLMKSQKHLTDAQVKTEVEKAVDQFWRSQLSRQSYDQNQKMNPKLLEKIKADIAAAVNNTGPRGMQNVLDYWGKGLDEFSKKYFGF